MLTSTAPGIPRVRPGRAVALIDQGIGRGKWLAAGWVTLMSLAAYASAKATPWLYPTATQRASAAEAINASPGIVALYGPILDVHSLGELAMTKMTVLYAVLVAIMCAVVVHRQVRSAERAGESSATALVAATTEAGLLAMLVGAFAAVASVAAGLPPLGATAFGASWTGIGLIGASLSSATSQLPSGSRTGGRIAAAAIGLLFALRALGDTVGPAWLSWLSPFAWSTRVEAWSTPRWGVLALYVIASTGLGALALHLNKRRELGAGLASGRIEQVARPAHLQGPVSWTLRRNGPALAVWTAVAGGFGAYLGAISSDLGSLLTSPNANQVIQRLGGVGTPRVVLIGAELSVIAAVITAYGISAFDRAADVYRPGRAPRDLQPAASRIQLLVPTLAVAVVGSTWLLFVTGAMLTVGQAASGSNVNAGLVAAALNHAPAVWTLVGMTAVAWSLKPTWTWAGWSLLALSTALGPLGQMMALPEWMVELSPYARIPLMPAGEFDGISTVSLVVGSCVLMTIAAYNANRHRGRR